MKNSQNWDLFRSAGLLVFVNTFLHIFGWAIVLEIDNDTKEVVNAYPKRVKYRGFSQESYETAYKQITDFMVDNAKELQNEINE